MNEDTDINSLQHGSNLQVIQMCLHDPWQALPEPLQHSQLRQLKKIMKPLTSSQPVIKSCFLLLYEISISLSWKYSLSGELLSVHTGTNFCFQHCLMRHVIVITMTQLQSKTGFLGVLCLEVLYKGHPLPLTLVLLHSNPLPRV